MAGAERPGDPTADPGPVFAALADPTRRSVLVRLGALGAASATTIARELPVTRQAVVQHLAVLDAAGLTRARRRGREVRHEVRPDVLAGAAGWMTRIAAQWDERLAVIAALAEGGGPRTRSDPTSGADAAVARLSGPRAAPPARSPPPPPHRAPAR